MSVELRTMASWGGPNAHVLRQAADDIQRLRNEMNVLKAETDYEEVSFVEALEKPKKLRKARDKT